MRTRKKRPPMPGGPDRPVYVGIDNMWSTDPSDALDPLPPTSPLAHSRFNALHATNADLGLSTSTLDFKFSVQVDPAPEPAPEFEYLGHTYEPWAEGAYRHRCLYKGKCWEVGSYSEVEGAWGVAHTGGGEEVVIMLEHGGDTIWATACPHHSVWIAYVNWFNEVVDPALDRAVFQHVEGRHLEKPKSLCPDLFWDLQNMIGEEITVHFSIGTCISIRTNSYQHSWMPTQTKQTIRKRLAHMNCKGSLQISDVEAVLPESLRNVQSSMSPATFLHWIILESARNDDFESVMTDILSIQTNAAPNFLRMKWRYKNSQEWHHWTCTRNDAIELGGSSFQGRNTRRFAALEPAP